jgi:hypothetical protein
MMLVFQLLAFLCTTSGLFANASTSFENDNEKASYTVCNGMSNQLLGHFSALAFALHNNASIAMPDAYIINGVQSVVHGHIMTDITPTAENSIPIGQIFDIEKLRKLINGASNNTADLNVVPSNDSLSCGGWVNRLKKCHPKALRDAVGAIAPSPVLQKVIDEGLRKMGSAALENGVCLHHRDGQDWHAHCKKWGNIADGMWRENCLEQDGRPIGELVKSRLLEEDENGNKITNRILYYVGDHDPPRSHLAKHGFTEVINRPDILPEKGERQLLDTLLGENFDKNLTKEQYRVMYRDLWAVIDFFTCLQMKSFVGNSVSTWSDLQLAARNGYGMWYNSRSIPLAKKVRIFPIPIIYTYTEHSQFLGKIMLKVSILSVREHMGELQPIHILYMGDKDTDFLGWLKAHDIVVHAHKPKWTAIIERLRLAGDPNTSHLFAHAGNYLGTWQRIDIPNLIESEYILYLDADTVVTKAFTLGDFGLNITAHIAFSLEQEKDIIPHNAGVALMNVPKLRETKGDFLKFIAEGETKPFSAPSDQGAYLDFYHPEFLDRRFNIKPYFNDMQGRKVMHFHGPKPYEIYKFMIGMEISPLMTGVIKKARSKEPLCTAMMAFAKSASVEPGIISEYCTVAFAADEPMLSTACTEFLELLPTLNSSSGCDNMAIYRFFKIRISNKSLQNLEEQSPGFIKVIDQKDSTIDYSILKEQSPGFIKVIGQKDSTIDYSFLNRVALVMVISALFLFAKSSERTKNAGKIFMSSRKNVDTVMSQNDTMIIRGRGDGSADLGLLTTREKKDCYLV